ncbi:MAG TPA: LAGLIDADG family homing endonuclease [Burkholderiales bacterium]|nr:LAGLIDADG family homing endonuclease [Burkholderiales bacterium]
MSHYRTIRQLDAPDAAYIAGLVDGEGTVTLTTMHRAENRRLVVSISNTERGLLELGRGALGAGQITGKRTYSNGWLGDAPSMAGSTQPSSYPQLPRRCPCSSSVMSQVRAGHMVRL